MLIYCFTNKISGKKYIGQTIGTLERRLAVHKNDFKRKNSALAKAVRKYGWDNFAVNILAQANTLDELNALEIRYIKEHNTLVPNGYNITEGGRNAPCPEKVKQAVSKANTGHLRWLGKKHTEETKRKISIANSGNKHWVGRKHTEETKLKISLVNKGKLLGRKGRPCPEHTKQAVSRANTGRPCPFKGIKRSLEFCAKISASKTGKPICTSKKIIGTHKKEQSKISLNFAAEGKKFGFDPTAILKCCYKKPKFKSHKKFIWEFVG